MWGDLGAIGPHGKLGFDRGVELRVLLHHLLLGVDIAWKLGSELFLRILNTAKHKNDGWLAGSSASSR